MATIDNRPYRLLIVEDHIPTLEFLQAAMQRCGYSVDITSRRSQAFKLAAAAPYDLILMDMHMLEILLRDACIKLKALQPRTPLLLMAIEMNPISLSTVQDLDVHGPIIKPINVHLLDEKILFLIQDHRQN
ncbi:MAG: response regulator [Elusimicrobiota bacterium]|jgi:response regulator RpfG family c-di-GMP phosphodiesterase